MRKHAESAGSIFKAPTLLRFPCKIPLERLSLFCSNLGVCLRAGLDVPTSLQSCARSSPDFALREILEHAVERTTVGMSASDSLERWRDRFPPFFLPVLRCGEESGREDEALAYLEQHCRLLAGPARTMRNTWLAPLAIMLVGSIVCAVAYLLFAPLATAFAYIVRAAESYSAVTALIILIRSVPQAKWISDGVKLVLPVIGPAERKLAMNRFFHVMNLFYSTGGWRVEEMIGRAAQCADNVFLRADFLRAARAIERGGTIAEAFSAPLTIPYDLKCIIASGDEAGKLEDAFDTVARMTDESLQRRLIGFQQLFFRAVAFAVIFSMTTTIFSLLAIRG